MMLLLSQVRSRCTRGSRTSTGQTWHALRPPSSPTSKATRTSATSRRSQCQQRCVCPWCWVCAQQTKKVKCIDGVTAVYRMRLRSTVPYATLHDDCTSWSFLPDLCAVYGRGPSNTEAEDDQSPGEGRRARGQEFNAQHEQHLQQGQLCGKSLKAVCSMPHPLCLTLMPHPLCRTLAYT
jgi:hypothetical protein